ncbi:peptidase domain-containing ABC transporter [Enterobacteriaceae bacterium C34A]
MPLTKRINFGLNRKTLPMIFQGEVSECGLACIAMIASYYGNRQELLTLRNQFPISQRGAKLSMLLSIAQQLHLTTRTLRLETDELNQLRLPCMLHWDFKHFVVLKAVKKNHLVIHDPELGARKIPMKEVDKSFTGVAVELWPNEHFNPHVPQEKISLRQVIGPVSGIKTSLMLVLLMGLLLEVFSLLMPFLTQWTIDQVIPAADYNLLSLLIAGFTIVMITRHLISIARDWSMLFITTSLSVQWRSNVFNHLMHIPASYFSRRHLGDVVSRFGAVDAIQATLTSAFFVALLDGAVTIFTLTVMFIYSVKLTFIAIASILIYSILRALYFTPLRNAAEEQIIHGAKQQSHFIESIRGIKTIRLFQQQSERAAGWISYMVNQVNAGVRVQKLQLIYRQSISFLSGLESIIVIGLGAGLVIEGQLTVGAFMAFSSFKSQFSSRISNLIDKFFELKMLRIQTERLADIVLTEREKLLPQLVDPQSDRRFALRVENVSWRYSDLEPKILQNLSFEVQAGDFVAITGTSGCGKSTLLELLCGNHSTAEGSVVYIDQEGHAWEPAQIKNQIATVLQDDVLLSGTILDNITFFASQPDEEFAVKCAQMAAIYHDIQAMPMQFNTLVGDMGTTLSGGQKQRILLARALYKKPQVLLLDEATSHLDLVTEQQVNQMLAALNLTRIVIAHRPHTLAMAQRILVMKEGEIAQVLTPHQLLQGVEEEA